MGRRGKILLAFEMACFIACLSLHTIKAAESKKVIRIGYIDYGSFIELDESGNYSGYGVEYLTEIAKHTGWKYEYVYDTWENCLSMLKRGEIDFVGTAQKTAEREKDYAFAKLSNGVEQTVIYTRMNNDHLYYNDYKGFDGKKVALLVDSFQTEFFKSYAKDHGFSYQAVYYKTEKEMVKSIKDGVNDLMVGGSLALHEDLKVVGKEGADPFYFMTYQGNDKTLKQLNEAMSEIQNEHPYYAQDLNRKFYGNSVIQSQPQFTREEAKYIQQASEIKVGYLSDCYPISMYDATTDQPVGIVIDIMNEMAKESGLTIKYVPIPVGEIPSDYLKSGKIDLMIPTTEAGSQTQQNVELSNQILDQNIAAVMKRGKVFDSDKNYKVVFVKDYPEGEKLIGRYVGSYTPVYKESIDECLQAVIAGEADVYFENYYIAAYRLKSPYYSNLQLDYGHTITSSYAISALMNQKNSMLLNVLNKTINALDENQVNDIINVHTLADNYNNTVGESIHKYRLYIFLVSLLILCIVFAIFVYLRLQRRNLEAINRKNQELEESNQDKMEFFARMSHDMRTPMNGILGMVALSEDEYDVEILRHNMDMIQKSGTYMLSLINDTLDMQKIEKGSMVLEPQIVKASQIYENMIGMFTTTAKQKKIQFNIENKNIDVERYIRIDPIRITQVFINLTSNAIKFTPEGGKVEFIAECIERKKGKVHDRFVIRDTGVGMSQEYIENGLFKPYSQEQNSLTSQYVGSGLGVAISKNLLDLMGAKIQVESEIGKGTTFTIDLEIEIVDDEEAKLAFSRGKDLIEQVKEHLQGKEILVCEDHPLNAEITKKLLEKVGCKVTSVKNGMLGVEIFHGSQFHQYAAILMDIHMPVMDGLTATKEIRSLDRTDAKTIPIIAMTANAYEEDKQKSMNAGMNEHLAKPVNPKVLYETLYRLI